MPDKIQAELHILLIWQLKHVLNEIQYGFIATDADDETEKIKKTWRLKFHTYHRQTSRWFARVSSFYSVLFMPSLDPRIIKYVSDPGSPGVVTVSLFRTNKSFKNADH